MMGLFFLAQANYLYAQELNRKEVANRILRAEAARGMYRIKVEHMYLDGHRAPFGKRTTFTRLQDSQGNFATIHHYFAHNTKQNTTKQARDTTQFLTWNQSELRVDAFPSEQTNDAHNFSISDNRPSNDELDWIEIGLGRRLEMSPRSPGELLSDPSVEAIINFTNFDNTNAVEIEFPDPIINSSHTSFTYWYDPSRNWMMIGFKQVRWFTEEQSGKKRFGGSGECKIIESKQVNGIWMPWKIEWIVKRPYPNNKVIKSFLQFLNIDLQPKIIKDDFYLSTNRLPKGSSVVDNRLGISYKLGDDVLYMDGHLHQLTAPITSEVKPEDLAKIMKGSTPLIDPDENKLQPLQNKSPWYAKRTGLGLIALGLLAAAIAVWKRSRA